MIVHAVHTSLVAGGDGAFQLGSSSDVACSMDDRYNDYTFLP